MVYKELVNFITEARYRGFNDYQITEPLMHEGWPLHEIEQAFAYMRRTPGKNQATKIDIVLRLDSEVIDILEKRAKKNKLTLKEQMEDILRRSAINTTPSNKPEKLDDNLVGIFSRKNPIKRK